MVPLLTRRFIPVPAIVGVALMALLDPTQASTTPDGRIVMHVAEGVPDPTSTLCTTAPPTAPCSDFATESDVDNGTYSVYLFGAGGDPVAGIAGISVGIQSTGTAYHSWTLCADLD